MFSGVPIESVLQVIQKTNIVSFSRLYQTCKWVKDLIDNNSKRVKIYPQSGTPKLTLRIIYYDDRYVIELRASPGRRVVQRKLKHKYSNQIWGYRSGEAFKDIFIYFIAVYSLNLFALNKLDLQIKRHDSDFLKIFFEISLQNRITCRQLHTNDFHKKMVDVERWWFGSKQWRAESYQTAMQIFQPRIWHTHLYGQFPADKVTRMIAVELTFCCLKIASAFFNDGHIERLDHINFHLKLDMLKDEKCLKIFDQYITVLKVLLKYSDHRRQQIGFSIQKSSIHQLGPAHMETHLTQNLEDVFHHQYVLSCGRRKNIPNKKTDDVLVVELKIWLIPTSVQSRYLFISKYTMELGVTANFIENLTEFNKILNNSLVKNGFSNVSKYQKSLICDSVRSLFT